MYLLFSLPKSMLTLIFMMPFWWLIRYRIWWRIQWHHRWPITWKCAAWFLYLKKKFNPSNLLGADGRRKTEDVTGSAQKFAMILRRKTESVNGKLKSQSKPSKICALFGQKTINKLFSTFSFHYQLNLLWFWYFVGVKSTIIVVLICPILLKSAN